MKKSRSLGRRLRLESLEERRMLAVFFVDDNFAANNPAAGEFTTIQAAVTAASAGDKIKVRAGTYEENVVINKQLKIVGAHASLADFRDATEASIVDPVNNTATGGIGIAFDIQADGVEIEGFTIGEFDTNTDADGTIGIRTSASHSGYRLEDNVIEANTIGIYLNSDTSTTTSIDETEVLDNIIRNNNRAGTNTGNGIYSDQGLQNVEIKRNLFSGTNAATSIRIVGEESDEDSETTQTDIRIRRNDFENLTGAGIYFENVVNAVIDNNDLETVALSGIQLNGGNENVTIKYNDLVNPGVPTLPAGPSLHGIVLSDTEDINPNENNLIRDNYVSGAGLTGIAIQNSANNVVRRNKIEGSLGGALQFAFQGNGISLQNADNNLIEHNRVEENARHGIFVDNLSTGNTLSKNKSQDNATEVSAFDYNDSTTGGTGTAGTQNTYIKNKGVTQNVTGLIANFI